MIFKRNDIVKTAIHDRLMVIDAYTYLNGEHINKRSKGMYFIVTEGGSYTEDELTLIYRHKDNKA